MVVIRLARHGSKHSPKYRITVADQRRAAGGRYIEIVGQYNPQAKGAEKALNLDIDKVKSWVAKGAQPTRRVQSLMKQAEQQ